MAERRTSLPHDRPLRVSVLGGCDPTGIYMIERLREKGLLGRVHRVVWKRPPGKKRPLLARLGRFRPRKLFDRAQSELLDRHMDRMLRDMCRELFDQDEPPPIEADHVVEARRVNGEAFAAELAADAPDLLLVNGAPILKEQIFGIPSLGTVNCHFGIAPLYRGSFTLFWPLYHGDYDNVGATLHYLTRGLDAGPIIGHAYPPLGPGDDEATVMARSARVAAELLDDFTEALRHGRREGVPQPKIGALYRKKDRRGVEDASYWLERKLGLTEIPHRPARRVLLVR